MDKTPKYIIICARAKEIQELWNYETGDYYFKLKPPASIKVKTLGYWHKSPTAWQAWKRKENIWLPRQDQLQEMVKENLFPLLCEFYKFIDPDVYTNEKNFLYIRRFDSMEQLWLAFVMKEKFGKIWNGKEWIKGGELI